MSAMTQTVLNQQIRHGRRDDYGAERHSNGNDTKQNTGGDIYMKRASVNCGLTSNTIIDTQLESPMEFKQERKMFEGKVVI